MLSMNIWPRVAYNFSATTFTYKRQIFMTCKNFTKPSQQKIVKFAACFQTHVSSWSNTLLLFVCFSAPVLRLHFFSLQLTYDNELSVVKMCNGISLLLFLVCTLFGLSCYKTVKPHSKSHYSFLIQSDIFIVTWKIVHNILSLYLFVCVCEKLSMCLSMSLCQCGLEHR